jgi:hypothetical protein
LSDFLTLQVAGRKTGGAGAKRILKLAQDAAPAKHANGNIFSKICFPPFDGMNNAK